MSRPWISCNLAISADGKISSPRHRPATWTSATDHARLVSLRRPAQALMVGRGTLEADKMTLTVPDHEPQPLRCVISRQGEFAADHPLFHRPGGDIHLLITDAPSATPQVPATIHHLSLADFLKKLRASYGVEHLHCEGGGQLIHALAEIDAIDEFHLTLAGHTLFGGALSPTATGIPGIGLPHSRAFALEQFVPHPEFGECFLSYRRKR